MSLSFDITTQLKPYSLSKEEVLLALQSGKEGLSESEVSDRLSTFGFNRLEEKKQYSVLSLFIRQFTSILVLILILAGIFAFFVGETLDSAAIFAIVFINAVLGFFQEYKAEKSLEALKKIETLKAHVLREGKEKTIESEKVVPGDVIILYEGDKIPADARIFEAFNLEVDESMLTGESSSVLKEECVLAENVALADRKNMVFSGCIVVKGKCKAVIALTGMRTEIGKIAEQIQKTTKLHTPLQKALERLGKVLAVICLITVIPTLVLGIVTGRSVAQMVMMAISLAVAAIPEGLPIVVTIALALGINRMAKVNVLIRKLSSAETLGGVDVICSDKTGTITHNKMTVSDIFIPDVGFYTVAGDIDSPDGGIKFDSQESKEFGFKDDKDSLKNFIENSVLCCDATMDTGDPTERALVEALQKNGGDENDLRDKYPRKGEIPFNSSQKYMSVVVSEKEALRVIVKGAAEVILKMCDLSREEREKFLKIDNYLSKKGLRVLAVAQKKAGKENEIFKFHGFSFSGMVGMYDPPRKEVSDALQICKNAGIRVIMITGDHKNTALSVAQKIGLQSPDVVTGEEIDAADDKKFEEIVKRTNIFARVSPSHKVRILSVLQRSGYEVAMTGDGVNDAPAVKLADVGICVGSGTDLAKGVSDMVILDDNFATIPKGVMEGRRIFFNIKKFLLFLLSANFAAIAGVFTCILLGLPLLLLPLQVLWLNLVTDSFPALALSNDVAGKDIMRKKPYKPSKEILNGALPFAVCAGGIGYIAIVGIFLISLFVWNLPESHARTIAFTTTVFFELFIVFSVRSEKSAFEIGIFSNKLLWGSIILGILGQLLVIYTPLGQQVFKTVPLSVFEWVFVIIFALSGFIIIESVRALKKVFIPSEKPVFFGVQSENI